MGARWPIQPDVQEEVGGAPYPSRMEEAGSDDVGVDAGDLAIRPVEHADVVPEAGEGEPDCIGSRFQYHPALYPQGPGERHPPRQRDLHPTIIVDEPLSIPGQTVGRAKVVDLHRCRDRGWWTTRACGRRGTRPDGMGAAVTSHHFWKRRRKTLGKWRR